YFGYFNPNSTTLFFWGFWALVDIIAGTGFGQVLFYGTLIGASMFFVYLFVTHLLNSQLSGVIASLFYIFNFFFVLYSITPSITLAFAILPLMLFLYSSIIEKMKK